MQALRAVRIALPLTVLILVAVIPALSSCSPDLPQSEKTRSPARPPPPHAFEAVRGMLFNSHGYFFTVSPNEEWIAVIHHLVPASRQRLRVLHRKSGKTWDHSFASGLLDSFPDCFSAASDKIYLHGKVAGLASSMTSLGFSELAGAPNREPTTFLGYPTKLKNPSGQKPRPWFSIPQSEGEFGMSAWSVDGATKYESLTKGQVKSSFLRITPSGRNSVVQYTALLNRDAARLKSGSDEVGEAFGKILADQIKKPAVVRLARLSVSPDGRFLAAVATLYRGAVGFAGMPYGVVIPLDRGGHAAYPFANDVYGKILWSADSKAFYYYAQPDGAEKGTVYRQDLAAMEFSATVERTDVPAAKLNAPSDSDLQEVKLDQLKLRHYALLREEFAKPQTIVEFVFEWGFTKSGHVIRLFGVRPRPRKESAAFGRNFARDFAGRPLKIELPSKADFLARYIPGSRTGVFGDRKKYPWRKAAGGSYGTVPVLIYEKGLVNARFSSGKTLEKYK